MSSGGYPPPLYGSGNGSADAQRPLYGVQPVPTHTQQQAPASGGLGYPLPGHQQHQSPPYYGAPNDPYAGYGYAPAPPQQHAFPSPQQQQQSPHYQPQWGQQGGNASPPQQQWSNAYSEAGGSTHSSLGYGQPPPPPAAALYAAPPSPSPPSSTTHTKAPPPAPASPNTSASWVNSPPQTSFVVGPAPVAAAAAIAGGRVMQTPARYESGRCAVLRKKREMEPTPEFDVEAHLIAAGHTMEDILNARAEHAPRKLPFAATSEEIAAHGGHGIRMFFEFVKFYGVIIFVVAVFQIWVYAQASKDKGSFRYRSIQGKPWYGDFFISAFSTATKTLWYDVNAAMLTFGFLAPFFFALYAKVRWGGGSGQSGSADATGSAAGLRATTALPWGEDNSIDKIIRLTATGTIDVSARYRSNRDVGFRRTLSVVVFIIFLVAQVFVTFALSSAGDGANFGVAFAISIAAFVIDLVYTMTATAMTEFEKHLTNSKAMRWLTLKLMCFKVANIMAVYGGRKLATPPNNCVYLELGEQFLTLWFVQLIISIPANIIFTMVWADNYQAYAKAAGSISSDNSSQPPFTVASEYLTILYIGFLTLAGMIVFPLSAVLALIAMFIVYWSAKFRLCKLCAKPLLLERSSRIMVAAGMLLSAFAGLFTPTAGGVFVLSGYTVHQTTNSTCLLP